MITDLGSLTLAVITPSLPSATAAITAVCDIAAPNVNAQLTALASFSPQAMVSIADQITMVQATLGALIEASLAVPPIPTIDLSAQVALALEAVAALELQLEAISLNLALAVDLNALLANGSVRLLTYSGPQDDFGTELAAELGAPTTSINALVLLTSNSTSWSAMQTLFKTTP